MAKRDRVWHPKPHRAVEYNEKAIQKVIDQYGYILVSPKVDGIRALIRRVGDTVSVTTREGIEILSLARMGRQLREEFDRKLPSTPGIVADCEIFIADVPFDESSGILRRNSPLADVYDLRIAVFDVTFENVITGEGTDSEELAGRVARYWPAGGELDTDCMYLLPTHDCADLDHVRRFFQYYREAGLEGLIIKHPMLSYRNGKVSGWWKMKPEITEDGVVTGYVWGEEGKANEGKIVGFEVELESGETVRATGLTREAMEDYTELAFLDEFTGQVEPIIGRYCEVKAMERTASGKLRHPHFKCWRDLEGAEGVKS